MFITDELLIEKARIALLAMDSSVACAVTDPLSAPYGTLRLAVFNGDAGSSLAATARKDRRLGLDGHDYRLIADISSKLDREDILLVERA